MSKTNKKEKVDTKVSKKKLLKEKEEKQEKKFKTYHWAVEVYEYKKRAGLQ